jgi:hypothetical protein
MSNETHMHAILNQTSPIGCSGISFPIRSYILYTFLVIVNSVIFFFQIRFKNGRNFLVVCIYNKCFGEFIRVVVIHKI